MVKELVVDNRCTGCNQCISTCPKKAIKLTRSKEGFWFPEIQHEDCIHCGICARMCPVYGEKPDCFSQPESFAGWNLDNATRFESSSGGIFSLLAEKMLDDDGSVYGAAFNSEWQVEHIRITKLDDLSRLRGSKYVQSYISPDIYEHLKRDIKDGRKILFSGTPCQTAAVSKLAGGYEKLYTVDIVCHGVPSPKAWNLYLNELRGKSTIKNIRMRSKEYGWNRYHMIIEFENNAPDDRWLNDNPWGKSFVRSLFLRPSCYQCEFKEHIRSADISLGDFWEAARGVHTEFDDEDRGTSVILVNSEKGRTLMEGLSCFVSPIPYDWIPKRTYAVVRSSVRPENRENAFRMLYENVEFSKIVEKCTADSFMRRVLRKAGGLIKRK